MSHETTAIYGNRTQNDYRTERRPHYLPTQRKAPYRDSWLNDPPQLTRDSNHIDLRAGHPEGTRSGTPDTARERSQESMPKHSADTDTVGTIRDKLSNSSGRSRISYQVRLRLQRTFMGFNQEDIDSTPMEGHLK